MDRPYIESTVKAYLIEREVEEDKFDEYNTYLVETMDYLKVNYECAYNVLHDMTRIQQQGCIYQFLDHYSPDEFEDLELSQEDVWVTPTIIIILITALFGAYFEKKAYDTLIRIQDGFVFSVKKVRDAVHSWGKKKFKLYEISRKIIDNNFGDCRKKAGFSANLSKDNIRDLRQALTPSRKTIIPGISKTFSTEDIDNARILRDCYLDYLVSTIATTSVIYAKCIVETGEVSDQSISTDHGMSALMNYPTGESCQVLYDQLIDQHEAFMDVLDVFFKDVEDDPRERQDWIKRLDDKVRGARRGDHLRPTSPKRYSSTFKGGFVVRGRDRGFKERYIDPANR